MKIKSNVKAGRVTGNHNQTVACALKIKSRGNAGAVFSTPLTAVAVSEKQ